MAEEQDILAELEAGEAAGGKKSPLKLIIILLLVAALGGGGYFAYMTFMADDQKVAEEGEGEEGAPEGTDPATGAAGDSKAKPGEEEEAQGTMATLDPFIVNLAGSKGKRFLKVNMVLELNEPGVRPEYNENVERIVDSILVLLSSKTFEEVYSVQGKFKLKDEITTRVNRFLLMGHVKDVFFTEFVIQ